MDNFIETEIKKFNLPDAEIAKIKEEYLGLEVKDAKDKENYLLCKEAHQKVRSLRTSIDKKRKELKEESLKFGRAVDAEAKRLTTCVLEVETHLLTQRKVVEDEIKRAQEELERKKREEEERIKKEEEERLEAIRLKQEAEQKKIEEEQRKLAEEKAEIEAMKKKLADDQEAIVRAEAEKKQRELAEKRHKEELENAKKEAAERAIKEEKERVQRERQEKIEQARRAKEDAERLEALKPDMEKIERLADDIRSITYPSVESPDAIQLIESTKKEMANVADAISAFAHRISEISAKN